MAVASLWLLDLTLRLLIPPMGLAGLLAPYLPSTVRLLRLGGVFLWLLGLMAALQPPPMEPRGQHEQAELPAIVLEFSTETEDMWYAPTMALNY